MVPSPLHASGARALVAPFVRPPPPQQQPPPPQQQPPPPLPPAEAAQERDRRAATFYAVKVPRGGRKTCKVAWRPPPRTAQTAQGGGEAPLTGRRFAVVSRAPDLLHVATPEVVEGAADGRAAQTLSLKFSVTGPSGSGDPGRGAVLEALAEIYEVNPADGSRAAVDLLEFTVQVLRQEASI